MPTLEQLPPSSGQPSKPWWSRLQKKYFILAIGLIIVIAGVITLISLPSQSTTSDKANKSISSVYYDRSGFNRKDLSTGVGDPAAISMRGGTGRPTIYQGVRIIQACNILTIQNIRNAGVQIAPNPLAGPVERFYYEGQSTAQTYQSELFLPGDYDSNQCSYALHDPNLSVSATVFQVPLVTISAINREMSQYTKTGQIAGLDLYKRSTSTYDYYMVFNGTTALQITTKMSDQKALEKLLNMAVANFNHQVVQPTSLPIVSYESPLMKNYVKACDLMRADDIRAYFGIEASPMVHEKLGSAIGTIEYNRKDGSAFQTNYIANVCSRYPASSKSPTLDVKSLGVRTNTYKTVEGAQSDMNFLRGYYKGARPISGIGDEAFASTNIIGDKVLNFRKGSTEIELTVIDESNRIDIDSVLRAFAQRVASRL